jgi:hypothetical protein
MSPLILFVACPDARRPEEGLCHVVSVANPRDDRQTSATATRSARESAVSISLHM